jgi:hypothetical protein
MSREPRKKPLGKAPERDDATLDRLTSADAMADEMEAARAEATEDMRAVLDAERREEGE